MARKRAESPNGGAEEGLWGWQDSNLRRLRRRFCRPFRLAARALPRRFGDAILETRPRRQLELAEALCLGQPLELLERVVLDLADAFARHTEGAADLLERQRLLPGE